MERKISSRSIKDETLRSAQSDMAHGPPPPRAPGSRTHAPDENIRLPDFLRAARHIARILDGFAGIG